MKKADTTGNPRVPFEHSDPIPPTEPNQHYKISMDRSQWDQIPQFMNENKKDPAVKVSIVFCAFFLQD
ncbi:hypothetical protein BT96DRAFT_815364 [Gymnopus androsaceus JB14]|uniref:Uncharacterized protein n=1 Tax=Gymnopus androsaceus JB14 TaxID=1447944 RepID=A0A6A4HVJ0_9AGAR|nr:hypothetical protein BT96DRAFT_815364 [Gymnopus androsaceus JB14]